MGSIPSLAVSGFDRLAGAEDAARVVFGLHGHVRFVGAYRHGRLEALPGDGSYRLEVLRVGSGEHPPGGRLRGPVPTGVDVHFVTLAFLRRHGGVFCRASAPHLAEGPVGLGLARELEVEEQLALPAVLGVERFGAPTHEDVAVREHLHVALGGGQWLLGVGVLPQQGGPHRLLVQLHHYAARLVVYLRRGAVVEDGDGAVGLAAGVVLGDRAGALTHLEVAPLAAQAPHYLAAVTVHLVNGVGSLGVDKEVAVRFYLYGVDVEVVEGHVGVFRRGGGGPRDAHVVPAVPLEKHLARPEVELLGYAVPHRGVVRAADGGE